MLAGMADELVIENDDGVCVATIDAPPLNIISLDLYEALAALAEDAASDESVRAVVLRSANPEFFIAHFDVDLLIGAAIDEPARRPERLGRFHRMCETFRTMPKVTICEIAGRIGGGGGELAASFDMRFGAIESFVLNPMEVPIGILPGGSGTQRLPTLVGRGRAMEIVLGAVDIDAPTAERWGWLNRAVPDDELRGFVDGLARRVASFPATAVAFAKESILNAGELEPTEGLLEEQYLFQQLMRTDAAQDRMRQFLERGGQTPEGEHRIADLVAELSDEPGDG
jgi:enoyl-CoA hydratase/carnithine racemase